MMCESSFYEQLKADEKQRNEYIMQVKSDIKHSQRIIDEAKSFLTTEGSQVVDIQSSSTNSTLRAEDKEDIENLIEWHTMLLESFKEELAFVESLGSESAL